MALILAIETSTARASVALLRGDELIASRESADTGRSDDLLLLVDECLRAAELELSALSTVAVGAGPGSFTGLRVGMATAKGLCFGAGLSLTPVSSLAALAAGGAAVAGDGFVVPVLDARRGEIFAGFYRFEGGACHELAPERVLRPDDLAAAVAEAGGGAPALLCGDALAKHGEALAAAGAPIAGAPASPSAGAVARLAAAARPAETLAAAAPAYLRRPDVEIRFPHGNRGGGTFGSGGGAPGE